MAAKRIDTNQPDLVALYRHAGCRVLHLHGLGLIDLPAMPVIPPGTLAAIRREAERAQLHAKRCLALLAQLEGTP